MRLALNQALQGFDGSVILVSHDRHLLRSVCDDLWLVDNGMLQQFEQDLDHYPSWLAQRKSRGENSTVSTVVHNQQSRRQQKFQLNQLNKIEKNIAKLHALQESLELKLEDSSIYDAANRDQLNANLAKQAENRKLLAQAEEDWLQLSESIEQQAN
jgi:ATP-binding cassette subfamily F protein 3